MVKKLTLTPEVGSVDGYRHAVNGVGPLAHTWRDKPHRLVYDLCAEVDRLRDSAQFYEDLRRYVVYDAIDHWGGLVAAVRRAVNGSWSLGCEMHASAIRDAASLVGATSWFNVPCELLVGGVYEAMYDGMPHDSADRWAHLTETEVDGPSTVARYAASVAAIRQDAEGLGL